MHAVTSFHAASVDSERINAIMADHLALERARIYRRLFVTRCGLLALLLGALNLGFRWLSPFASWFTVGLCAVAPAWAWLAELRCDWRLARRLRDLPADATHVVVPPWA